MGFRMLCARLVCLALFVMIVLAGCGAAGRIGGEEAGVSGSEQLGTSGSGAGAGTGNPPASVSTLASGSSQTPALCATEGWKAPTEEVMGAFQRLHEVLPGSAVLAPRLLPTGSALATAAAGDQGGARGRVSIQLPQGTVDFLEVIQGDLGDLPSTEVALATGRTAAVYHVFDGILVQWAEDGAWYGVYGVGLSSEVLVAIAGVTETL